MRRILGGLAGFAALGLAAGPAMADEGMWTIDNFPMARVNAAYGASIDPAWLDKVRATSVRIPGCSASVVSGQGLVMTNYHCLESCAGSLSTAQNDYFATGFLTATREEEKRCVGMWAEVLQSIEDVSGRLDAASGDRTGAERVQAQTAEIARIETEGCEGQAGMRCQVIAFYGGGQYKLYRYRRYDDVRLVFAPEFSIGFFGGDPDNFNFPRYNLDVGFLRLYDGDRPVTTPDHLAWNPASPTAGEPIFLPGNPGSTQRQLTQSQLTFIRDVQIPFDQSLRSELRGKYYQFGDASPEARRMIVDRLNGLENVIKVYDGRFRALANPDFFGSKAEQEADLRARVAADPELARQTGDAWGEIDRAYAAYADLYPEYAFLVTQAGAGSTLFNQARTIVRAAIERPKPAAERLSGYDDAALARARAALAGQTPVEPEMERLLLIHWLSKAREKLTVDSETSRLLLGRDSPENKATTLVEGTRLADPAERLRLFDGGLEAVQASDDPMIKLALAVDPAARAIARRVAQEVTGPTGAAQARLAQARFAVYGDSQYPDATFSLRLSYGQIKGWTERGREIPPFTTFAGLYARDTGQAPFDLPASWERARDTIDMDTVFDFSGTNDVIGGASGSPTLNARGEVIGIVFDGNIHSLGGAFGYDPVLNRSVHVAASGIQEALLKVYGRRALVDELNGR